LVEVKKKGEMRTRVKHLANREAKKGKANV